MTRVIFLLMLTMPLLALRIDPDAKGFDNHVKKRQVEVYDFSGLYPHLENIDIDAIRKKNVEFDLSGTYPLLRSICYEGSFGAFDGLFTGSYPLLDEIKFKVTSCRMKFDLRGQWEKDCEITITGTDADFTLQLPKDVGLVIHTQRKIQGKVIVPDTLKKKGHFLKKSFYANEGADVTLTLNLVVTTGQITLE